jgi:hypothetical protein
MAIDFEELEDALVKFRLDIINRLTEISSEINALQAAVLEAPVDKKRLAELREASRKIQYKFGDVHAQNISLPHQLR